MATGAASFINAPVTKALFITTAGSSIFWQSANIYSIKTVNSLVIPFVKTFVFQNIGELVFGLALVYVFRNIERQWGSRSFGSFAFLVTGISVGLQAAFKTAYKFQNDFPTGPYGFIFASLLPFIFDVPPTARFNLFGIEFSDKTFVYLAGLRLLLASGMPSVMAALCGILAGFTFKTEIFGLKKFKFPDFMCKIIGNTIGRLLEGRRPRDGAQVQVFTPSNQRIPPRSNGLVGANVVPMASSATAPNIHEGNIQVSQASLEQLTSMGFDVATSERALRFTGGDVQAAIHMLVEGH